jgi:hypothetical protein
VTRYGLADTANVYGVALIGLALLALALSHRLQDPEAPASRPGTSSFGQIKAPRQIQ